MPIIKQSMDLTYRAIITPTSKSEFHGDNLGGSTKIISNNEATTVFLKRPINTNQVTKNRYAYSHSKILITILPILSYIVL